jgi:hypothetical protein
MRDGEGSDGDALATTGEEGCGVLTCAPPSDRNFPTKSPRRIFPRGRCNYSRWCQYASDLPDVSNFAAAPDYFIASRSASEAPLTNLASRVARWDEQSHR